MEPHKVIQCYLPLPFDTGECAALLLQLSKGWKSELAVVLGYIQRWFIFPQTITLSGSIGNQLKQLDWESNIQPLCHQATYK